MGLYVNEPFKDQVLPLSDGLAGTWETVAVMGRLAQHGAGRCDTRNLAEKILRSSGVAARDWPAESRALTAWVRNHIRYTRDGLTVETLKTCDRMLDDVARHGFTMADCDDAAVLLAALLLCVGHAPAFQVLGRNETPHHVNVVDKSTGLELDPTGEPRGAWGFREVFDVSPLR